MTLHKPTFDSVRHVAAHMRTADAEEIWPLRFNPTPDSLAGTVMSDPTYVWLAAQERPIAVFGMFEVRPKAWTAFAFATDEFPKVAAEVTKFLVRRVRPHLFETLGARRVEAWSHGEHSAAHSWLQMLGATGEPDPDYGPNGETYLRFVLRRSDLEVTEARKTSNIVVSGGKPDLARSADILPTAPHVHPQHS